MFRRGKKIWMTAALVLALLLTASPGRAAWLGQDRPLIVWEGLWEKAAAWFGVTPAGSSPSIDRNRREKSSSQIDPNGQPASATPPAGSTPSDSSSSIDPNGHS